MNDKSMINNVAAWWRGLGQKSETQRPGRYCPAGHPMDPNWETCPRCAAEQRAREKTVLEKPAVESGLPAPEPAAMTRSPTVVSGGEPESGRGAGRPNRAAEVQAEPTPKSHQRRITGVLVTFTWQPQGQLFALYEGRNVIGSGTVESEGGRDCDVQIRDDNMLSNEHAVILCRNGRYELIDRQSTNGTYMNDGFVESQGVKLPDGARIRTGATIWLFRTVEENAPNTRASVGDTPQPPAGRDKPANIQRDPG